MSYAHLPDVYNRVPCEGCTLCCNVPTELLPGKDDFNRYEVDLIGGKTYLKRNKDGSCVYVQGGRCAIHDNAPWICKEFDCRKFAREVGYTEKPHALVIIKRGMDLMQRG